MSALLIRETRLCSLLKKIVADRLHVYMTGPKQSMGLIP